MCDVSLLILFLIFHGINWTFLETPTPPLKNVCRAQLGSIGIHRQLDMPRYKDSDARSLIEGEGELDNLKTYSMTSTTFHKDKLKHII